MHRKMPKIQPQNNFDFICILLSSKSISVHCVLIDSNFLHTYKRWAVRSHGTDNILKELKLWNCYTKSDRSSQWMHKNYQIVEHILVEGSQ